MSQDEDDDDDDDDVDVTSGDATHSTLACDPAVNPSTYPKQDESKSRADFQPTNIAESRNVSKVSPPVNDLISKAMAETMGVSPTKLASADSLRLMGLSPAKIPRIEREMKQGERQVL